MTEDQAAGKKSGILAAVCYPFKCVRWAHRLVGETRGTPIIHSDPFQRISRGCSLEVFMLWWGSAVALLMCLCGMVVMNRTWRGGLPVGSLFTGVAGACCAALILIPRGASAFHKERDNGALEDLLLTPLPRGTLLGQRLLPLLDSFRAYSAVTCPGFFAVPVVHLLGNGRVLPVFLAAATWAASSSLCFAAAVCGPLASLRFRHRASALFGAYLRVLLSGVPLFLLCFYAAGVASMLQQNWRLARKFDWTNQEALVLIVGFGLAAAATWLWTACTLHRAVTRFDEWALGE